MNAYQEMMDRQQKEFDAFPKHFAFGKEQIDRKLEELGVKPEEMKEKLVGIGAGGFILRKDLPAYNEMCDRHYEEKETAIKADKDGTGFIKDMFLAVMWDHEYSYTRDDEDILFYAGISVDEMSENQALWDGFQAARDEVLSFEEE